MGTYLYVLGTKARRSPQQIPWQRNATATEFAARILQGVCIAISVAMLWLLFLRRFFGAPRIPVDTHYALAAALAVVTFFLLQVFFFVQPSRKKEQRDFRKS
jgi:uncharacterized BrkB/YihY/UPF0761 family membrane protein